MEGAEEWCTIESDPGVFTEVLQGIGCQHVELAELWSLDEETLMQLQATGKVYGLIFLFKWESPSNSKADGASNREPLSDGDIPPNLFFAHQTTTNAVSFGIACAKIGILTLRS